MAYAPTVVVILVSLRDAGVDHVSGAVQVAGAERSRKVAEDLFTHRTEQRCRNDVGGEWIFLVPSARYRAACEQIVYLVGGTVGRGEQPGEVAVLSAVVGTV